VVRFADLDPTPLLAVGARDGDLATRGFDPEQGDRRILVSGPPRSGRTNALEVLALRLAEGHYPVALVGTGWRAEVSREAVLLVDGTSESDRDGLIEVRRAHRDLAVLVDDGERLAELPIEAVLLEIARRVDEDRGVIVLATSTNAREGRVGALAGDLARAHTEIVLWPTGTPRVAGRAALRTPRGVDRIQVARISRR
jgi:S-DNA-T family DNA segregation ATPase FtsK/SpoIIIE